MIHRQPVPIIDLSLYEPLIAREARLFLHKFPDGSPEGQPEDLHQEGRIVLWRASLKWKSSRSRSGEPTHYFRICLRNTFRKVLARAWGLYNRQARMAEDLLPLVVKQYREDGVITYDLKFDGARALDSLVELGERTRRYGSGPRDLPGWSSTS